MTHRLSAIGVAALTLSLAGCGDPSYEDMVADKEQLQKVMDDCKEDGYAAMDKPVCKDAQRAAMKVTMDAVSETMGGALQEAMRKAREAQGKE